MVVFIISILTCIFLFLFYDFLVMRNCKKNEERITLLDDHVRTLANILEDILKRNRVMMNMVVDIQSPELRDAILSAFKDLDDKKRQAPPPCRTNQPYSNVVGSSWEDK